MTAFDAMACEDNETLRAIVLTTRGYQKQTDAG
jgi:hypothetical protein